MVGIEKIINTNNPTKNILIKLILENTGETLSPNPSDKYWSTIGTSKKLEP